MTTAAGSGRITSSQERSMSGHSSKALFALALILGGVGLWAGRAAAPPAGRKAPPAAQKKEKKSRLRDRDFRAALAKPIDFPGIDDPKTTLAEALDQLAKDYGVVFDVNERAFKFEQLNDVMRTPITDREALPSMKGTPLAKVLQKVLNRIPTPSGATFLIRRDAVEITTAYVVRRELRLPQPESDSDEPTYEPLVTLLWEELRDEPVAAVLARIAEAADTTILVDPRAKEKAATKVTATLRNVPLDDAIELLADMAGLAVVVRTNVYYVTTPENAARMKLARPKKKAEDSSR
jgi:hypothetical protein